MPFRIKISILSALLFFSKIAFSITCPLLSDVQTEGISKSQAIASVFHVGYEVSQYNTGFDWIFIIGYFINVTPPQAIIDANLVLAGMSAPGVLDLRGNRITCHYDTGQNYTYALAIRDIFQ